MNLLKRWSFGKRPSRRSRLRRWSQYPAQVESLETRTLLSTYVVTSALDTVDANDGVLTLREAITAANATAEHDTITFNIGSGGAYTIQPLSALPYITKPLTIDGTSQPGYSGTPLIELDGSRAGITNGLNVTGGGSTVRGLVINRFLLSGIALSSGGGNTIEDNWIGTDFTGTLDQGNGQQGIRIDNSANNTVRNNTISGNNANGIALLNSYSTGNMIQGNKIGTTADGNAALGNGIWGIIIQFSANNSIGGGTDSFCNVISSNTRGGILLVGSGSRGNVIAGNRVGTCASGVKSMGNGGDGIRFSNGATGNFIGGSGEDGNVIAFNGRNGITLYDSTVGGNSFRGNAVHGNAVDQIDPGPLGCSCVAPTIHSAEWNGSELRIVGTFTGAANTTYFLDFFLSATDDPSTFVGGQQFLFSIQVTTDANGQASFDVTHACAVDPNQVTSATTVDSAHSLSLFSAATTIAQVEPPAPPPPPPEPEPEPVPEPAPERTPAERLRDVRESLRDLIRGKVGKAHMQALLKMLAKAEHHLEHGRETQSLVMLKVSAKKLTTLMKTGRLDPEDGQPLLEELRRIIQEVQEQRNDKVEQMLGKLRGTWGKGLDDLFSGKNFEKFASFI